MMLDENKHREWVQVFSALASDTRLRIVIMLAGGKMGCQEILSQLDLSQPAVSYHLGKLEHAGVLVKERNGTRNCYRLHNRISELVNVVEKEEVR
ncbi:MAG TPA: ArsR family transcriptional regulator [Candidatus Acetothermia bacterium]|nr:winged helix-turn-helix transcriptional regulator [Candidatus Bipolaricaulota bacterium]HDO74566.1 ArsR family transcriptional regulator [Candidatus Acetothermia bacterium]HEX32508.1 ArsR family transcriptional regulator [Candidatus Acetothermia bacterium]